MAPTSEKKSRVRRPDLDTVFTINDDGSRNFIHPADVHGRFLIRKRIIYTVLIAIYVFLPWITVGGHPALLVDLPARNAYIFGWTFTNQDFYLVFFLVTGLGFSLFVVTSLFGRIWCGYACPQTVFLEGVFRPIERWIEGSRESRLRKSTDGASRVVRKVLKNLVYILAALVVAHVFLSYFIPVKNLWAVVTDGPSAHLATFGWTTFWTVLLYYNYAWFREQTCLIICPYGRIQSALTDADTLVIGYDEGRGEPRSKKAAEGGDCIDCHRCVVVCPTGIDIRRGLQMECIGCANCIDACDEIMDKTGRPRGLVRYDSQHGFEQGKRRGYFRPRTFLYGFLALLGMAAFVFTASKRTEFDVRVLRPKGLPYTLEETQIRNLYNLRIQNKRDVPATFFLSAIPGDAHPELEFIVAQDRIVIDGLSERAVPIFATVPRGTYEAPFVMAVAVEDSSSGIVKELDVRFRGPN